MGLLSALNQKIDIIGGQFSIVDPTTQKVSINGVITKVSTRTNITTLTLKQGQWTTVATITRSPLKVVVGDDVIPSISPANADKSLLVTLIQNTEEFGQELSKVRYYESKIADLNTRILEAHATFKDLSLQLENRRVTDTPPASKAPAPTTIIQHTEVNTVPRPYYGHYNYQYYNPTYYVPYNPPVYIPNSQSVSIEEKQEYIQKKKQYINTLKNR